MTTNMKGAVAGFSKEDAPFFFIHILNATYLVKIVAIITLLLYSLRPDF